MRTSPYPEVAPASRFTPVLLAANFTVLALTYGALTLPHYSSDTWAAGFDLAPIISANLGRFVVTLFATAFERIGFFPVVYQTHFAWLMLAVMTACVTLVTMRFLSLLRRADETPNWRLIAVVDMAVLLGFVNVFIFEWLLFPEVILYFAIALAAVTGAFLAFSHAQEWRGYLASAVLLWIALNTYQAAMAVYFVLGLAWILVLDDAAITRRSARKFTLLLGITLACAALNVLSVTVLQRIGWLDHDIRDPGFSLDVIRTNLGPVWQALQLIWRTGNNMLPANLITLFTAALVFLLIAGIQRGTLRATKVLVVLTALALGVASTIGPHLLTATVWPAPRSFVAIFFVFAMLALITIHLRPVPHTTLWVAVALHLFVLVNVLQIQSFTAMHFANNRLELAEAHAMLKAIEAYELSSGETVTKIATQTDAHPRFIYDEIPLATFDINTRSFVRPWADYAILRVASGRPFLKVAMTDAARAVLFAENDDWDQLLPEEQIYFDGDTAFIAIY